MGYNNKPNKERKRKDLEGLKQYAVWLLGRRDYSEKEMEGKLKGYCQSYDDVEKTIIWLYDMHYLDDKRFAENKLRSRMDFSQHGPTRIRQELKQKGIPDHIIAEVFEEYDREFWSQKCKELYERKYSRPPVDYKEKDKRTRFLVSRGFNLGDAATYVENPVPLEEEGED